MLQNQFFCNFSKTSEKTAYLQKKVCQNPQRSSRCRYARRKKSKTAKQKFFRFGFGGTICRLQSSRKYMRRWVFPWKFTFIWRAKRTRLKCCLMFLKINGFLAFLALLHYVSSSKGSRFESIYFLENPASHIFSGRL